MTSRCRNAHQYYDPQHLMLVALSSLNTLAVVSVSVVARWLLLCHGVVLSIEDRRPSLQLLAGEHQQQIQTEWNNYMNTNA